jgi:hypothetical protein
MFRDQTFYNRKIKEHIVVDRIPLYQQIAFSPIFVSLPMRDKTANGFVTLGYLLIDFIWDLVSETFATAPSFLFPAPQFVVYCCVFVHYLYLTRGRRKSVDE